MDQGQIKIIHQLPKNSPYGYFPVKPTILTIQQKKHNYSTHKVFGITSRCFKTNSFLFNYSPTRFLNNLRKFEKFCTKSWLWRLYSRDCVTVYLINIVFYDFILLWHLAKVTFLRFLDAFFQFLNFSKSKRMFLRVILAKRDIWWIFCECHFELLILYSYTSISLIQF